MLGFLREPLSQVSDGHLLIVPVYGKEDGACQSHAANSGVQPHDPPFLLGASSWGGVLGFQHMNLGEAMQVLSLAPNATFQGVIICTE